MLAGRIGQRSAD